MAKPFVKWAGGKTHTLDQLRGFYPKELTNGTITRYIEPFVGGGAVLFDIIDHYPSVKEYYICDIQPGLMNAYLAIRDRVDSVIMGLEILESLYNKMSELSRNQMYYTVRDDYNNDSVDSSLANHNIGNAIRFIFLNKTCFNGLFRVNTTGKFNVPHGSYKNPCICNINELKNVSTTLANVRIMCGDYRDVLTYANNNTFIYIDPPYRPISKTSTFTKYARNGFTDDDQKTLASSVVALSKSFIMVSSSDPKNTNTADTFFDGLYKQFNMHSIIANRSIGANKNTRVSIKELLITNY